MSATKKKRPAPATFELSQNHRDELHASGLTDETIAASGIYSATSGEVKQILGWARKGVDWGRAMVFPYHSPGGDQSTYQRVKPDYPRSNGDGKVVKYESPKGSTNRAYFPPGFFEALDSGCHILVTEGEKKALAAMQAGFPCIGLPGVWGWQEKRLKSDTGRTYGERRLIADLASINWKSKHIVSIFDSDAATNSSVQLAEARLAESLSKAGATVRVARLPAKGDDKVGVDDFLVANGDDGPAELAKVINAATEPETPKLTLLDWARMYIDEERLTPQGRTIRWWRDEFWGWDGKRYRVVPVAELCAILIQWMDSKQMPVTPRLARDVVQCLGSEVRIAFDVNQPAYFGKWATEHKNWISMANGLLDLDALIRGQDVQLRPHTPKWFSPLALPYDYDPTAECPVWFETINEIFDGDEDRVDLLSEWFGYCITEDTSLHAILLIEGPPRSGKGTILRAMRMVVGAENCCSPRLFALGELFGLWGLLGKRLAICPDAHLGHGDRAIGVLETLKLISGEDAVEIHRKQLPPITTRLNTRFALAVNELPKFGDAANALASRVLILPCRKSFIGREDRSLEDKLVAEASGIFRWAIEGLIRLRSRRVFTKPEISKEIEADFARLVSPLKAFIEDMCVIEPAATVERSELWAVWGQWCDENGHLRGSRELLGTRLRALIPSLDETQPRKDGQRVRCYIGLGLRPAIKV